MCVKQHTVCVKQQTVCVKQHTVCVKQQTVCVKQQCPWLLFCLEKHIYSNYSQYLIKT